MVAVGVVFSAGGKVYSFDPAGLELSWAEQVICQTSRGQELGRVVRPNHDLPDDSYPLKKVIRRATDLDAEIAAANRDEARAAVRAFRPVLREQQPRVKPISAELVFDGSRLVFAYESDEKP